MGDGDRAVSKVLRPEFNPQKPGMGEKEVRHGGVGRHSGGSETEERGSLGLLENNS